MTSAVTNCSNSTPERPTPVALAREDRIDDAIEAIFLRCGYREIELQLAIIFEKEWAVITLVKELLEENEIDKASAIAVTHLCGDKQAEVLHDGSIYVASKGNFQKANEMARKISTETDRTYFFRCDAIQRIDRFYENSALWLT